MEKATLSEALGKKYTDVTLDGKSYKVGRATMGDLAALQTELEIIRGGPVDPEQIMLEAATPRGSTFLLWRVLHKRDEDIELEALRDMMPATDIDLWTKVIEALGLLEAPENPPEAADAP